MQKITTLINGLKRRAAFALHLHPSSNPYLSGDTFRSMAHHVHDEHRSIVPAQVENGEILFVCTPRLDDFFTTIAPQITARYILLSHNGDRNIVAKDAATLPPQLIHWFAQNCLVADPRISPLPIGLENKHLYLHGIPSYYEHLRTQSVTKDIKILYKFNVATNPTERGAALAALQKHPLALTYTDWRQSYTYLRTLQQCAFVASPAGNGEDCIRTWESFYLGTIPILKRTIFTEYLASIDLPVVLINDWDELAEFDTTRLEETYAKIAPKFNNPAIWAPYWKQLMSTKQHEYQS